MYYYHNKIVSYMLAMYKRVYTLIESSVNMRLFEYLSVITVNRAKTVQL